MPMSSHTLMFSSTPDTMVASDLLSNALIDKGAPDQDPIGSDLAAPATPRMPLAIPKCTKSFLDSGSLEDPMLEKDAV